MGHDETGRVILAVAVEGWLFDKLAALEDLEPEPDEDDPAEDGEGALLYLGSL
jgi:hypothetical protein